AADRAAAAFAGAHAPDSRLLPDRAVSVAASLVLRGRDCLRIFLPERRVLFLRPGNRGAATASYVAGARRAAVGPCHGMPAAPRRGSICSRISAIPSRA